MNIVTISGVLTKDVELKYTSQGMALATISIAYNHKIKKGDEYINEPSFFECKAFGRGAEVINQYFKKGKKIILNGRLKQESWITKDGGKAYKVVILIEGFEFPETQSQATQAPVQIQTQTRAPMQSEVVSFSDDEPIPF